MNSWTRSFLHLVRTRPYTVLIVAGCITFANALFNQFVWDDIGYILEYSGVTDFLFPTFFNNNMYNNAGEYRPLMLTYFALAYSFFKTVPFFYHVVQIGIHIANATLFFRFLKRHLTAEIALFLAVVFLVHPAQVESVSYISGAGNVLYLFGGLWLLNKANTPWSFRRTLFMYFLLLLTTLMKETGMVFLILLGVYRLGMRVSKPLQEGLLSIGVIVVYTWLRYGVAQVGFANRPMIPVMRLDLSDRLFLVPQVVWHNLLTMLFPLRLGVNQHWVRGGAGPEFFLALVGVAVVATGIVVVGWWVARFHKKLFWLYLFFACWLGLNLGLHSQIIPLNMTVADRWLYSMLAGGLGLVGIVIQTVPFTKHVRQALPWLAVLIVSALSIRTVVRNTDWRDQIALFDQAITVHDNYLSRYQLSVGYQTVGNYSAAEQHIKQSIQQFPMNLSYYQLGYIYEQAKDYDKAVKAYNEAFSAPDYIPDGHARPLTLYIRLINLQLIQGNNSEAGKILPLALQDYPDSGRLWALAAIAEDKRGAKEKAMENAERAVQLSPKDTVALYVYRQLQTGQPLEFHVGN